MNGISYEKILIRQDPLKEGLIEIRPGVDYLSLGDKKYGQVRIFIGPTNRYIKGMAVYSDNVPEGYDVVFYTRIKANGDFAGHGTIDGVHKVPKPMEIVDDSGDWDAWAKDLNNLASCIINHHMSRMYRAQADRP